MSAAAPLPVFAGSANRAAAVLLDLVLWIFLATWLGSFLPPDLSSVLAWPFALLYLAALPLTPLQGTLGKFIARIKLCGLDGRRLDWRRSTVRAAATLAWIWMVGNLAQVSPDPGPGEYVVLGGWATLFLAWGSMGLTPRGQTAFDLIAGSLVVRAGATPEAVAQAAPRRVSKVEAAAVVIFCVLLAFFFEVATREAHVRNLRGRIWYAIEATAPLREKIRDFHAREGRWPTAAELDVAEWTAYPAGGGYRLREQGVVEIGFSVLPELKGRTVRLEPTPAAKSTLEWKCSADPALDKRYLVASCR